MGLSYMQYYRNFFFNLKKFGLSLSAKEIKHSLITIFVTAFVVSFRQWGDETFDFVAGITNLLIAVVMVTICLFFFQLGQRLIAVYYGYDPEYEFSMIGVMISLVITFASRGYIAVILPGYVVIHMLAASRLGEFRYYTNLWEWAKTAFGAPLFNFVFACLLDIIPGENIYIARLIQLNIMFAIWSVVPLPSNPGLYMFWHRQFFWGFALGFVLGGTALLYLTNGFIALLGAGIFGAIFIYVYFVIIDNKLS